jgi:hypothetical protein
MPDIVDSTILPCGKCRFCVLDLARQWQVRAINEGQMHSRSSFLTLTYAPEHLPPGGSVSRRDIQLFIKRLRFWCRSNDLPSPPVFGCSEYGETTLRPHYHLSVFGLWVPDAVKSGRSALGSQLYTSETLSNLWGLGICNFGEFNAKSAGYVARYSMGKFTEEMTALLRPVPDPETGEMILRPQPFLIAPKRPALGLSFIEKYHSDVFDHDEIILPGGIRSGRVKFYDEWLRVKNPDRFEEIKAARTASAVKGRDPDEIMRHLARSTILEQRIERLQRGGV